MRVVPGLTRIQMRRDETLDHAHWIPGQARDDNLWVHRRVRWRAAGVSCDAGRAQRGGKMIWDSLVQWSSPAAEMALKRMSGVALLEPDS